MDHNVFTSYVPPTEGVYKDWSGCRHHAFVPTERQRTIIAAVQSALDAGLYYTEDVRKHCAALLGVTPEQARANSVQTPVEGGYFGLECFYARDYLREQEVFRLECASLAMLQPHVGQSLGTIMFNDFKRTTGATVLAYSDGDRTIRLTGKRGSSRVEVTCSARQIENAIDRAAEHGLRKTSFKQAFASVEIAA